MSVEPRAQKEFWIAFILNFVLPGAGHIYAGDPSPGVGLLIGNIVSWAVVAVFPIGFVGALGTWIYALIKSRDVVDKYNNSLTTKAAEVQQRLTEQTSPDDLVKQIGKMHQLLVTGMIEQSEFDTRKAAIVQQLSLRKLVGTMDDYLLALAPLKQSGMLSANDIAMLKRVLMAVGRP